MTDRPRTLAPGGTRLVTTSDELCEAVDVVRRQDKSIGLVPTMGALHEGHLSLVDASRQQCQFTVVTIFVNPTQFGPGEDLDNYPRTLDADLAALADRGVDLVFAPNNDELYRSGHTTVVDVGGVARPFEGEYRLVHFRGVATIVLKLFHLIPADIAYFGRKDFQQALVVRRMVADLDLPIDIRVCPTVRESDGLAISSRNVYLSPDERRRAAAIPRSLRLAADLVRRGIRDAAEICRRVRAELAAAGITEIDYVALADPETVVQVDRVDGPVVALLAVRVGTTRLIDNEILE